VAIKLEKSEFKFKSKALLQRRGGVGGDDAAIQD